MAAFGGPVQALVTDLAGTAVDFGSRAPAGVFTEVFRRRGIELTDAEARGPMGLQKREHIRVLTRLDSVAEQWRKKFGRPVSEDDVDSLYDDFVPLQLEVLPKYCDLIPGLLEVISDLRAANILVGATTGYNREMTELVLAEAYRRGFEPRETVCASDVPVGRPAPWMLFRVMERLGVFPPAAVVVIGDTIPDIEAGRNAGVWTIGVTLTGNMLGLSEAEVKKLPSAQLEQKLDAASQAFKRAGAHLVLESISDVMPAISQINDRLWNGERP